MTMAHGQTQPQDCILSVMILARMIANVSGSLNSPLTTRFYREGPLGRLPGLVTSRGAGTTS